MAIKRSYQNRTTTSLTWTLYIWQTIFYLNWDQKYMNLVLFNFEWLFQPQNRILLVSININNRVQFEWSSIKMSTSDNIIEKKNISSLSNFLVQTMHHKMAGKLFHETVTCVDLLCWPLFWNELFCEGNVWSGFILLIYYGNWFSAEELYVT